MFRVMPLCITKDTYWDNPIGLWHGCATTMPSSCATANLTADLDSPGPITLYHIYNMWGVGPRPGDLCFNQRFAIYTHTYTVLFRLSCSDIQHGLSYFPIIHGDVLHTHHSIIYGLTRINRVVGNLPPYLFPAV